MNLKTKIHRKISKIFFSNRTASVDKLYQDKDFIDGYVAHTDQRVANNPKEAIGGLWDEIGGLQFEFLSKEGLGPNNSLLDIGCGTLRGGRHFIAYLNVGKYTGIDISSACIQAGSRLIDSEDLLEKSPRLVLNKSKKMQFEEFNEEKFDFLLAQSVFTHLPADYIKECFENIKIVMNPESCFFFTYFENRSAQQTGPKDFEYPYSFFANLAEINGFELKDFSEKYPHPRGQKMMRVTQK